MFLIFCAYFGRTKFTALFLLSVGVGAGGLQIAGHPVGIIDMAPRFSGVIMGFMNLAGTIPGIIGPIIAKSIANAVSYRELKLQFTSYKYIIKYSSRCVIIIIENTTKKSVSDIS